MLRKSIATFWRIFRWWKSALSKDATMWRVREKWNSIIRSINHGCRKIGALSLCVYVLPGSFRGMGDFYFK